VVVVLVIRRKVPGSNPSEDDGFLRVIKIRSTISFGGEVNPSAPCKILRHVKGPCRVKHTLQAKLTDFFLQVSPCFASRCLLVFCQRALVDESGKIRT
jgi:hypothetical protein